MMRMCLAGERDCLGQPVRYYVVEEAVGREMAYGLSVTYRDEALLLPGVTRSKQRVQSLLERMMRGTVTPVAARDVVEDWLLE